jgi:hypothetical protein
LIYQFIKKMEFFSQSDKATIDETGPEVTVTEVKMMMAEDGLFVMDNSDCVRPPPRPTLRAPFNIFKSFESHLIEPRIEPRIEPPIEPPIEPRIEQTIEKLIEQPIEKPTMSIISSITDLFNSLTRRNPVESIVPSGQVLMWDVSNAQTSPALVNATFMGIVGFLKTKRAIELDPTTWRFNSELSDEVQHELGQYMEMKPELEYMLDVDNNGHKMLWVVAADDATIIKHETRNWPIKLDSAGEKDMSVNSMLAAARLKIHKPKSWEAYGIKLEKTYCRYNSGEFLQLTAGDNVHFQRDAYGFQVMTWRMDVGREYATTIRITDVTDSLGSLVPDFDTLRLSHADPNHQWQSSVYTMGKMTSIMTPINTAATRHVLGAENEGWLCAGTQAAGFMQWNSQQPCNLDCASITLVTYRGGGDPTPEKGAYEFYRLKQNQGKTELIFTWMVEVIVKNKVMLAYLTNQEHVKNSSK